MKGKEKCKALKEIRRQIAEKNDIEYAVSECTFQGECKGTCPRCEAELRYLERELAVKQSLGKAVAVAGISATVCTSLTACSPAETIEDFLWEVGKVVGIVEETTGTAPAPYSPGGSNTTTTITLEGDVQMAEPTEEPLMGEVPVPEATQMPEGTEIEGKLVEPAMTPLPEVLEGDVAVMATPMPATEEAVEEQLLGEIYIPMDGQE